MANRHRGEITATLDGTSYTLVLTLGALAELEDAFGGDDILSIAKKLQSGRLAARECVQIIGAGLRGAGHEISDADVAGMTADGGVAGFVRIIADLMAATFKAPEERAPEERAPEEGATPAASANEPPPGK